jgi:AcrR family transcriptional regulator
MPDRINRGGRPPRVNRDQVVAAAAELLTTGGPDAFSMRALAAKLAMSPMGIYHYFESKNDLLGAVLAHQAWSEEPPELPEEPEDRIVLICDLLTTHLTKHPWIIELQVSTESVDPYTAWAADKTLIAAEELGMTAERQITFVAAVWRLVLAEATIRAGAETQMRRNGQTDPDILISGFRDLDQLPHLQRAANDVPRIMDGFRIEQVIRALLRSALLAD